MLLEGGDICRSMRSKRFCVNARTAQAPYEAEGAGQEVANVDAVPLLLALLREARPPVQAWGLAALLRILRGSTANLSACDRCAAAAWLHGCSRT